MNFVWNNKVILESEIKNFVFSRFVELFRSTHRDLGMRIASAAAEQYDTHTQFMMYASM